MTDLQTPNILGYVRRSAKAETDDVSPRVQRAAIERYAQAHGLTIIDWYEDLGRSGYRPGVVREGWEAAMKRLEQRDIGAVVAYRADRFTRRGFKVALEMGERAEEYGTALISATEPFDSRNRGMAQMMDMWTAVNAETESARISERVSGAKKAIREQGGFSGGTPPYGFVARRDVGGKVRRLYVEPDQATLLVEAAEKVLSGQSLRSIVRELNAAGRYNRQGRPWNDTGLRSALRNPAIAGYQAMRLRPGDDWTILRDPEGEYCHLDDSIVSPARYEQIRKVLAKRNRPIKSERSLLGGRDLLVCASCGGPMNAIKMKKQADVYRCSRFPQGLCQRSISIDWKGADDWVRSYVRSLVSNLDVSNSDDYSVIRAAAQMFNATIKDPLVDDLRQTLENELAELQHRIDEIDNQFVDGDIDAVRHRKISNQLLQRIAKANKSLSDLPTDDEFDVDGVLEWIETLRAGEPDGWSEDDFFTIARYLIAGVVVLPWERRYGKGAVDARMMPVLNSSAPRA